MGLLISGTLKTLTVAFLVCTSLFGADAPMFRGNALHNGIYGSVPIGKFGRVKWKFHTGGMVFSSPAVVGGVVYVGSNDGNLYAVDLSSGKQRRQSLRLDVAVAILASTTVSYRASRG